MAGLAAFSFPKFSSFSAPSGEKKRAVSPSESSSSSEAERKKRKKVRFGTLERAEQIRSFSWQKDKKKKKKSKSEDKSEYGLRHRTLG